MSAQEHIDGLNDAITFAKVIAEATARERERCIAAIEAQKAIFMSPEYATGQPLSTFQERFACDQCIEAIRRPSLQDSEV